MDTILTKQTALDNIASGIESLTEQQARWILLMHGQGKDRPDLYTLPERLGIENWVETIDRVIGPVYLKNLPDSMQRRLIPILENIIVAVMCGEHVDQVQGWNINTYRVAIRPWISVMGPIIVVQ